MISYDAAAKPSAFGLWRMALLVTGVTCLSAQLSTLLPFTPVPITMQVFAVLLSGLLLGGRFGAIAQTQYLLLGLAGLPVFALGRSGPGVLFGITGGYLLSYPLAALAVGWIAERNKADQNTGGWLTRHALACAVGIAIIYGSGCIWLALLSRPMLSAGSAALLGAGWFLLWDAAKAALAITTARLLKNNVRLSSRLPE